MTPSIIRTPKFFTYLHRFSPEPCTYAARPTECDHLSHNVRLPEDKPYLIIDDAQAALKSEIRAPVRTAADEPGFPSYYGAVADAGHRASYAALRPLERYARLQNQRKIAFFCNAQSRQPGASKQEKQPRIEVYWTTVTYRTVAIYVLLILVIVVAGFYTIHPEWYSDAVERMSRTPGSDASRRGPVAQNQARFVNLDGKVEVKKANSVSWENADYRTTLDKGDLIRTGGDGAARITFVDGTTYTVKNDSFVTVEENSVDRDRATSVGVHISSGAVDLATGTWQSPGSKAEVSFANARASLQENSRAAVRSDAAARRQPDHRVGRRGEHAGGQPASGDRQVGARNFRERRWTGQQNHGAGASRPDRAGQSAALD